MGKVRSLYRKTCLWCNEDFETSNASVLYCSKEECQNAKADKSRLGNIPAPHEDLRIGIIAIIMADEKISYTQYTRDREFYINRYIKTHGNPY